MILYGDLYDIAVCELLCLELPLHSLVTRPAQQEDQLQPRPAPQSSPQLLALGLPALCITICTAM